MKTSTKTLFLTIMMMSTFLVLNSTNWINMWMGLEMNLMAFIPIMFEYNNKFISQSIMMYFLIQSMASMMFLTLILTSKYLFMEKKVFFKTIIIASMMMKMGMPPFHFWFPEISNKMKWNMCLLLMTWQKIAPMYILSTIIEMSSTINVMICLSAMVSAIGGINQTSTRKIMAYSSMNHMSWMVACAATFKKSWIIYMILYSMLMVIMALTFYEYNIMFINQMNLFFKNNFTKMSITIMMLSMGGIPPFLGFLPKWITIQYMISSSEIMMMLIMTTSALITLSYYLRLSSSTNLISNNSQKWMILAKSNTKMTLWMLMLNMTFPLTILVMNMF